MIACPGRYKDGWDTIVDAIETYPSLINCLAAGENGFCLDLAFPSRDQTGAAGAALRMSPFSRTIPARIKTDGDDTIQDVLLVLQRDQYETSGSLVPLNNNGVETAWQNAFTFHQNSGQAKAPIFFKHQVSPKGDLKPFHPLFHCRETRRWFHPVCPQCGLGLTLCRDDALLGKRGLPSYSGSMARFLYCGSCTALSDSSSFYSREKVTGMPDIVHDASALVTQWKHLLANLPDGDDLPCRGCPEMNACYGPESLASQRIVPFSFYPFYMMIFPAPSYGAAEFLPMISGATDDTPYEINRFFFQNQDRQFLEILYLKLTLLEQVFGQLMPAGGPAGDQGFDLSLESIGVDLNPAGAGLPAYWSFNARILDAIGTSQASPFAPIMPQSPRLHFFGAVWFRTLLVNSTQGADAVYADVARSLDYLGTEKGVEKPEIDTFDSVGVFSPSQIFWVPDQRSLPENWTDFWKRAMRLGFQMVQAGLKTGVFWDNEKFRAALDDLREQIRTELFSGPAIAGTGKEKSVQSDKIVSMLHGILEKWQAEADTAGSQPVSDMAPDRPDIDDANGFSSSTEKPLLPSGNDLPPAADLHTMDPSSVPVQQPDVNGWEQDIQETMVISATDSAPQPVGMQPGVPEPPAKQPQWNDDSEETIVLQSKASTPSPTPASPMGEDDMDRTVVISSPSIPPDSTPPVQDEGLAATMIQTAGGPPSSPSGGHDDDLEATVMINTGIPTPPVMSSPPIDDDLAATMIQGAGDRHPASTPTFGISDPQPSDRSENGDDLDATVVISPASQQTALNPFQEPSPGTADDDLEATMLETPRGADRFDPKTPVAVNLPPTPPVPPQPPREAPKPPPLEVPDKLALGNANEDDDIMEETIIIRSNVKRE